MALEAPLRSSVGSITAMFSTHADMSFSTRPESPALPQQYMASSGSESQSLRPSSRPESIVRPSSAQQILSPSSDIVGPSPVTSNGTEATEIEDEAADNAEEPQHQGKNSILMLSTNLPEHVRRPHSEELVSVIHAPPSFQNWASDAGSRQTPSNSTSAASADNSSASSPPPSEPSTVVTSGNPPTVNTKVKPTAYGMDVPTPQAQKLEDVLADSSKLRSSTGSSLELIPETREADDDDDGDDFPTGTRSRESEIKALKAALEECWTLCNTLANLSSIHRARVFSNSGTPDAHERAWKTCWKLCKRLYHSQDDVSDSYGVRTNLDLCREFCQALFDIRQRKDETSDSILRVSFELNNHLYSAQDSRSLPEAFTERTLDFYITLCHRLMKQRSDLTEETDSLLRACWALAEMLFSLRQSRRDGKAPDEELLGSAVQACWELCDIFREGWTQIRPDRGTPKPNQITFFAATSPYGHPPTSSHPSEASRSNAGSRASLHSKRESLRSIGEVERPRAHPLVPETPVTDLDDTPMSPDASPHIPNIMVLGPTTESRSERGGRWSSNASNLSSYSQATQHTSSTATTATSEDINITRIKALLVKAAMNLGFNRDTSDGTGGATSLQTFVRSLPTGSFGSLSAHTALLQNYKTLILSDTLFRSFTSLPVRRRFSAQEIAKSVNWMIVRSGQYAFLRDLFKIVFGFQIEEAETRKGSGFVV